MFLFLFSHGFWRNDVVFDRFDISLLISLEKTNVKPKEKKAIFKWEWRKNWCVHRKIKKKEESHHKMWKPTGSYWKSREELGRKEGGLMKVWSPPTLHCVRENGLNLQQSSRGDIEANASRLFANLRNLLDRPCKRAKCQQSHLLTNAKFEQWRTTPKYLIWLRVVSLTSAAGFPPLLSHLSSTGSPSTVLKTSSVNFCWSFSGLSPCYYT